MNEKLDSLKNDDRARIIEGLQGCSSEEAVMDLFSEFGVENNREKIELLREARGNPQIFNSSEISLGDQVQREISVLLTGVWKLNEIYERAGF